MSVLRSNTAAFVLALTATLGPAQASAQSAVKDASCANAYTQGQDDRLAGRLYAARTAFLSCAAATCPAVVASDCRRWASEVEADLPTIRIQVHDARGNVVQGARVWVDSAPLTTEQLAAPLVLEAGPHTLRFEAAGFAPLELQQALRPTDREIAVSAVLSPPVPAAPLAPRPSKPVPTGSWVLAGVGAVALGASGYF